MRDRIEAHLSALGAVDETAIDRVVHGARARVDAALSTPRARPARRRVRRLAICLGALTASCVTGAAFAGSLDLASVLPGYSVAQTPVVPASDVAAGLPASEATALNALKLIAGVDLTQLHRVRSSRLGITVLIAPHIGGGICTAYIQHIATFSQCGDAATLSRGVMISNSEGTLYVGLRPDGVSSVTDIDGASVPVVDNVFISDRPIAT